IYERAIEPPWMDLSNDTSVWLGQRNKAHGYFKGIMQDVILLGSNQGYVVQCPDLNRTCPTCNDFHGLVQKIMELQDVLARTSNKLARAEDKMRSLDGCSCDRTCAAEDGVVYRELDSWVDGCRNCSCLNASVRCEPLACPRLQCPPHSAAAYVPGTCCKECQPVCLFRGRMYVDGERRSVRDSAGVCLLYQCQEGAMGKVSDWSCPALSCPESEQISLTDRCCKVCRGHDFCAEGWAERCVESSECVNLEAGAYCSCQDGYRAARDDSAYCQDIDECTEGKHYCRENTLCVNTAGSFTCRCLAGFIRVDDYSCTGRDECESGGRRCDENAICFNTVGGHSCSCKPGFTGNGTTCTAMCDGLCQNGGSCMSPALCVCPQGYTGKRCETDIDECETGRNSCAKDMTCVNVDGGYDCRCPHGKNCSGDCRFDDRVKHDGQIWVMDGDRCSVCSCQTSHVLCRRMVCDCDNPTVDVFCCPECDPRLSGRCLDQSSRLSYSSGDTWLEGCQQCTCTRGEVDCWPVTCAALGECDLSAVPEGECCPRCVADPCRADPVAPDNDLGGACTDESGLTRLGGATWTKHGAECTLCQCKNT
ncbi:unnamed protein product, partial [Gadus morhua 'NCC']